MQLFSNISSYIVTIEFSFLIGCIKYQKRYQSANPEIPGMWDWYAYPKKRFILNDSLVKLLDKSVNNFNSNDI